MPDKMFCPSCNTDLDGDLIYETFLKKYEGDKTHALETAAMYGATETEGRWGRVIGLYDSRTDMVTKYRCPDCDHIWERRLKETK